MENKPGANAMIGTGFVAKAPPDGYTLLICSPGPMTINPSLYPNLPYAVGKDIVPVSLVATAPMVMVISKKMPAKTYAELISYMKANPGKVSFASAGRGNVTHLTAELFMRDAGLSTVHVPYKGAQAVIADLLGGHIEMYFNPLPSARGYVKSNTDKVTALAVTSRVRSPHLPDVPTLDELGLKGFDVYSWYGLCAPGGTPKEIINKLSAEVARALSGGELPERLRGVGTNPQASTPEQFAEQIRKRERSVGEDHQGQGHQGRVAARRARKADRRPRAARNREDSRGSWPSGDRVLQPAAATKTSRHWDAANRFPTSDLRRPRS